MKKNENGFGALGVLVIVIVLAVIGFVGWKVWHDKNKKTPVASQTTNQKTNAPTTPSTTQTTTGAIDVQDWGVKVASLHNSDKLQIKVYNTPGSMAGGLDKYDGYATADFKSGVLKDDESCQPGLKLFRAKTSFTSGIEQKKIGDYYYAITGGPGACNNETDNVLRTQFYKDFVVGNISAI